MYVIVGMLQIGLLRSHCPWQYWCSDPWKLPSNDVDSNSFVNLTFINHSTLPDQVTAFFAQRVANLLSHIHDGWSWWLTMCLLGRLELQKVTIPAFKATSKATIESIWLPRVWLPHSSSRQLATAIRSWISSLFRRILGPRLFLSTSCGATVESSPMFMVCLAFTLIFLHTLLLSFSCVNFHLFTSASYSYKLTIYEIKLLRYRLCAKRAIKTLMTNNRNAASEAKMLTTKIPI